MKSDFALTFCIARARLDGMRYLLVSTAVCAALVVAGGASAERSAGLSAGSTTGKYIVVLKDNTVNVDAKIASLSSALGFQTTYRYHHALKGFAASLSDAQLAAVRADSSVQFVSPDTVGEIVATIKPGETVPAGVRRIESAVGNQIKKKSSFAVAISDTGIDLNHTDLKARNGKDCINAEPAQDDHGHGTHVAGTVGALNKGAGVVGVSPNTTVYAVKSFNSGGSGSEASAICGLDWITQNGPALKIKAVNMSWRFFSGGDDGNCGNTNGDALHKAICAMANAGIVPVGAAGNESNNYVNYRPASFNEVLTVTAMGDFDGRPGGLGGSCSGTPDDRYASFSSFAGAGGPDEVHTVAGPGVCVLSTRLGGGTTTMSGTSMASPHVAGTVANCLGHKNAPGPCAGMTVPQIIQKIRADAAAKPGSYGFVGDPAHTPPAGRYYGFLVSNLNY
jgi:subtilisin family serine protease